MSLSEDDVKKISKLAHLTLSDEQVKRFAGELASVLGYVHQLEAIDVSQVEPTSHVHGATNFFREDVTQEPMPAELGLANAPDTSGRFFRVPIIIEQSVEN